MVLQDKTLHKKWSFPLRIWLHLLKKSLMENLIFCVVLTNIWQKELFSPLTWHVIKKLPIRQYCFGNQLKPISCHWSLFTTPTNMRKPEFFRRFHGVEKETSGMKCVNSGHCQIWEIFLLAMLLKMSWP